MGIVKSLPDQICCGICGTDVRKDHDKDLMDPCVVRKLLEGYKKLANSNSKSLLKKHLTCEIIHKLKYKKTPTFGSTLLDCVQSGFMNHDSSVGIYASDPEAYTTFAEIFYPIIEDYHKGFRKSQCHPAVYWGPANKFGDLDPHGQFILSTRIRCARSIKGYPFNPRLTEDQYREIEYRVAKALSLLTGDITGKYYPLFNMARDFQQKLINDHFLFKEGDRFLQSANGSRFWPTGRGIYLNCAKTFVVWCNEEDHLRIIAMEQGGNLGEVYLRLIDGVNQLEKHIPFSHDKHLGFLTFCPTNLGSTIRASVHINIPKLAKDKVKLDKIAECYCLQVRGTKGEHTNSEADVFDISNKRRLGITEYEAVKEMSDGILAIIRIECQL